MMRALMIAKTGLEAQQSNMDVITNNIANISTIGFKKQNMIFEDLIYQNILYPGLKSSENSNFPIGVQLGTGVKSVSTEGIFSQGGLINTGNITDIAIEGQGFIQVTMPDGSNAYTRDGSLKINQYGQLVNSSGYIIHPNINLPEGYIDLNISSDGVISVVTSGKNEPQDIGQITIFTFANNSGLKRIGSNMFCETVSSGLPIENKPGTNGSGTLKHKFLENSNVNIAEELIKMIQTQRAYELNSKAISATDQMMQKLSQL